MRGEITVRPASAADAAGIVALNRRVASDAPFFLAYEIDPVSGAEILQAKLRIGAAGDGVLAAAAGDAVVGAALMRRHCHPAFDGVLQFAVSVDPDWRRREIGRRLTLAALANARKAGARRVQLAVVDGNAPALALFRAVGFKEEGRMIAAAEIGGVRHDVIPMACLL